MIQKLGVPLKRFDLKDHGTFFSTITRPLQWCKALSIELSTSSKHFSIFSFLFPSNIRILTMFVFALLVRYRGREEAIYTASLLIVRFENTTIVLAYQRCVLPLLSHVVRVTWLQFPVKMIYF